MQPTLRLLPLCIAATFAARAAEPVADQWALCRGSDAIPAFRDDLIVPVGPRERQPTNVDGDRLDVSDKNLTVIEGNVELQRADQWLGSDRLTYDHDAGHYIAEGNVRYQDSSLRMKAARAEGEPDADHHELTDIDYQLVEQRGSGRSDRIEVQGTTGDLYGATYSTCDPEQRLWELRARRIELDREKGEGIAHSATLRLGGVPVMYVPWMSFPIDDRRRTGFLYPSIGHSDDTGLDLSIPYYLNLAPNYDATLVARYMSRRGLMLDGEFRYLTQKSRGILEADWLPDDDVTGEDRGSARLRHFTGFNRQWYATTDLNHISDDRYFEDFGNSLSTSAIRLIRSNAVLFGRGRYWSTEFGAEDYEVADPLLTARNEPYARLPWTKFRWEQPFGRHFVTGVRAEAVAFDHDIRDGGERFDFKPYASLLFDGAWWFLRPQMAWRYTSYQLDGTLATAAGSSTPDRTTPIGSVDSGLFFERETRIGGRSLIQTLEPRLFYLYVPYENQASLPRFDARELTFSWSQLFRDNRFTGADRQADANQVTLAITTRFLEADSGREMFTASVGQIHYFDSPRVGLTAAPLPELDGSDYIADVGFNLDDRWTFGATQQWDPEIEATEFSGVRAQYRFGGQGVINAAYRYRRDDLEQGDVSFLYPISPAWRVLARWNYSLPDDETLEALGGVEWQDCCIAARLYVRRYVRNVEGDMDNAIFFEIELKGLGSFGRDTGNLLQRAILGYSDEFAQSATDAGESEPYFP